MPDGPSRAVHVAFGHIQRLLQDAHLEIPGLETVEDAMANLTPLDAQQKKTWDQVVFNISFLGTDLSYRLRTEAQRVRREFERLVGPMSFSLPSMLPWYLHESAPEQRLMLTVDVKGDPAPVVADFVISNRGLAVESGKAMPEGGNGNAQTFAYGNLRITLLKRHDQPGAETPGTEFSGDQTVSIPTDFVKNPAFAADSAEETALALRSVMEKLGLYRTRAVYARDIHIYDRPEELGPPEIFFSGYVVKDLPSKKWVRLFKVPPIVGSASIMRGMLDPQIKPDVAARAMVNLQTAFFILKEAGIAMESWAHTLIDLETGSISLGEGDVPTLTNASLLERASRDPQGFLARLNDSGEVHYHFPNLVAVTSPELEHGDNMLLSTIDLLADKSGRAGITYDKNEIVPQILRDFRLLGEFFAEPRWISSVENQFERRVLYDIVDHYLTVLRGNGIRNFMRAVLPNIVMKTPVEDWFRISLQYMNEAEQSGEADLNRYWATRAEEINKLGSPAAGRRGRGNRGPITPPTDEGNPGPDIGSNGPSVPQASGELITGYSASDEGANDDWVPGLGAAAVIQVPAFIANGVSPGIRPLNPILSAGLGTFVFLPAAKNILRN